MDRQLEGLTGRRPTPQGPTGPAPREDFSVLEPYVPLAVLFLRATTAMRYPAMGGPPLGLDWTQVRALAGMTQVPLDGWDIDVLDAMAAAACHILREAAARE